ncbi:hypothetical protein BV20DRAFT_298158 [Pilatotrama ljubarskyi]|nr:hypothetical protein BV20DRAFT_298158 [Pilatotrama ljubarskyi]
MAKVNATVLVLDLEIIRHFKNAELDEQLEVFRKRILDPVVPKKSKVSRRADKLVALKNAIIRYVLKPVVAGIQLHKLKVCHQRVARRCRKLHSSGSYILTYSPL